MPVVFIMGPTASGKTGLAMDLVERMPADIISVDSAMIYKGLDIGTAKPTPEELRRAPHALIDVIDPAQSWSVGEFSRAATDEIHRSHARGRIPLLTGGTMMYFRSLEHGLNELPEADLAVRSRIDADAATHGWPALHAELERHDPIAAGRIHKNDGQRIQRALEVFRITGQPISQLQATAARPLDFPVIKFALGTDNREELHRRISRRFDHMMQNGLLAEVEGLYARGDLHSDLPSIRSVGYRQLWRHLEGAHSLEQASVNAKTATRRLAKRQLTWLRSDHNVVHLPSGDLRDVTGALSKIQERIEQLPSSQRKP